MPRMSEAATTRSFLLMADTAEAAPVARLPEARALYTTEPRAPVASTPSATLVGVRLARLLELTWSYSHILRELFEHCSDKEAIQVIYPLQMFWV